MAAQPIMTIVAMASGAFLREEFWTLSERVFTEQGNGATRRNSVGRIGQNTYAFGVPLGAFHCDLVHGVAAIFANREVGQQTCTGKQAPKKPEIEPMPQTPAAQQWHQKNHAHDESGNNDCAP